MISQNYTKRRVFLQNTFPFSNRSLFSTSFIHSGKYHLHTCNTQLSKPRTPNSPVAKGTLMFKVTTITHLTDDTTRPLICLTTRKGFKYLFGKVPEGTQRVVNTFGSEVKFSKLQGIFLTGSILSWSDIGGLPGFFLTVSDATKNGLTVIGCERILSYILATWRQFVFRMGIKLHILDAETNPTIVDEEVVISPIMIDPANQTSPPENSSKLVRQIKKLASLMFPLDTSQVNSRDPESYKSDPTQNDIHTHVHLPSASEIATTQQSISYCISFVPVLGKFDPKKAKELGLTPGPQFRDLTNGLSVVNKNGDTITPDQVIAPNRVFRKILVIDVPSNDYYENTINSDRWFEHDHPKNAGEVGLVYHMLGQDLDLDLLDYKERFLSKFPSDTYHVISHPSMTNNVIMNDRFISNTLKIKSILNENFNLVNLENFKPLSNSQVDRLHALQLYHLNDNGVVPDSSSAIKTTNKSLFEEEVESLDIPNAANFETMEKTKIELDCNKHTNLKDRVQVFMLGTGSALPAICRNVLGNLIRLPYQDDSGAISYRSIVLDGGENTIGSLLRLFGHENGKEFVQIFQELSLIHLSHLHADHHLGIVSLINEWFNVNQDESKLLYLVVPWQFITFLKDWYSLELQYNKVFDMNRLVCISCEDFMMDNRTPEFIKIDMDKFEEFYDEGGLHKPIPRDRLLLVDHKKIKNMYETVGLNSVTTVRALHCAWAYSTTFDFKLNENGETFKISFSGDTRPNPRFSECGYGSDLLIHEASMDGNWIEEAIAKKHSTMIEAVAVSKLMNCPKLILTHFSSRYGISNNCVPKNELQSCADNLDTYLNKSHCELNIFQSQSPSDLSLEEIDLWFAYDLMGVCYGDMHKQEYVWPILSELFLPSAEVDHEKINEKKEVKRLERLAMMKTKKKRKMSPK